MNRKRMMTLKTVLLGAALLGVAHNEVLAEQKCNLSEPETTPTNRFKINTQEGTAYDTKTKLTWKICAEGMAYSGGQCTGNPISLDWNASMKTYGNNGQGWRMPNVDELFSIIEKRCSDPSINSAIFPDTSSSDFWSASAYAGISANAWPVHFHDGNGYPNANPSLTPL